MNRGWRVALLACAAVFPACRGDRASNSRRTGSAAPVELVAQPQLPDAGAGPIASSDELEPNDGEELATPLAPGGTARGRIDGEADVDYYRLEVDRSGVLQVALSGVEGVDLQLELLDSAGGVIGRSDRAGARLREGLPNAGVTPGRYALVVRQAPRKKPVKTRKGRLDAGAEAPAAPAPVYELSAQLVTPARGVELEPDDDRGTANDLNVGADASGFVGWAGDSDVWKLSVETLSEKTVVDLEVSAIDGVALTLEVADGVGQVIATRKAPRGQRVVMQSLFPVVRPGSSPFHYLTVRGDRSEPETGYTLRAAARVVGPDPELEPNDTLEHPQAMVSDRTVVHASWTPGDVDCFSLGPAPAPRGVEVAVGAPPEVDLGVELMVDGKPVATASKGGKGAPERLSATLPAGVTAVLRVTGVDPASSASGAYDVSVTETASASESAP